MRKVIIEADENDADYISEMSDVKSDEDLEILRKVAGVIKKQSDGNWENTEDSKNPPAEMYKGLLTAEEIKKFDDFVPDNDYGVHTIVSIRIVEIKEIEQLL